MTTLRNSSAQRLIARLLIAAMVFAQVPQAVAFTPAVAPLAATTTSVVRPNLMYVLDDSGSMAWDYTPDYINDSSTAADPGSTGGSAGDGALATVSGGRVTAIGADGSPPSFSHKYKSAPSVVIEGTVGTGASATATWNSSTQLVTGITVNAGGSGYTSAPHVSLVGPVVNATWGMCWGTTGTSNQGGTPKDTNASPTCTTVAQVPYSNSAINYQYYDPKVRYERPLKADGTRYGSAEGTTTNWTAAKTDGFSGTSTTTNLTASYQHEVWCNTSTATPSAADPTAAGKCRENATSAVDPTTNATASLQYTTSFYPNATFTFRKTYNGPAFYYVMNPSEYCTDSTLTNCIRSTTAQVVSGTVFNVPSYYRWCAYYNPQTHTYGQCQGRRDLTHYIPNYLGGWVSTGAAGVQATATLKVGWSGAAVSPTVAGQQITGVTIGGTDVVGGQTFVSAADGDQATVASNVCSAIQANTGTSGYSCSVNGANITVQAAISGTAPNGLEIVASGPAPIAATNSTGTITVLSAVNGYQISTITINRTDSTSAQLLAATVTSDGDVGNTARAICQGINSGLLTSEYEAKSGDPADVNLKYPSDTTRTTAACQSNVAGFVGIRRIPADTRDNGASIVVVGPPTGTQYSGTITVNSTAGDTRINDITLGGTTVLTAGNKPLSYPSGAISAGTDTSAIAADIASKITSGGLATGCTVTSTNNVVTFRNTSTPATGLCSAANAIVVSATSASATGTFRVSSTGDTNGANVGGIQTTASTQDSTTPSLMGSLTVSDGTAVSANATSIRNAINAFGSGYSAAVPVLNGSSYDITVTAPAGGINNGRTFNFLDGTAGAGTTGQPSIWTFPLTGASADNAALTSITCGGTTAVPARNTGVNGSATNWIQNLVAGFQGKTVAGPNSLNYTYSCTTSGMTAPAQRCTITASGNGTACNLAMTPTAGISVTNNGLINPGSTAPQWTFSLSDATAEPKTITSLSCGATNIISATASTGSGSAANHIANLTTGLTGAGTAGYTYAAITGAGTGKQRIRVTGPKGDVGGQPFCNSNLAITYDSATISLSSASPSSGSISSGAANLVASPTGTAYVAGTQPTYTFTVNDATTASKTISSIRCPSGSTRMWPFSSSASTGSAQAASYAAALAADIQTQQQSNGNSNDWSSGNGSCSATSATNVNCQLAMSSGSNPRCTAFNVTTSGGLSLATASSSPSTLTGTTFLSGKVKESDDGNRYWYSFDISGANAANQTVSVSCTTSNGTQTAATNATTGPTQRSNSNSYFVNNLVTDMQSLVNASGWSMSCTTPADNATHPSTCTLTGPVSSSPPASCAMAKDGSITVNNSTATSLTINKDVGTGVASNAGTSAQWTFDILSSITDNRTIGGITCSGTNTMTGTANSGTSTPLTVPQRLNNLASAMVASPTSGWTISQTQTAASGVPANLDVTGPVASSNCTWTYLKDASITASTPTQTAGTGASTPSWSFDITNATADNLNFGTLTCSGTSLLPSPTPNTGTQPTSVVYQRMNQLTGANAGTGASGSVGPTNGYTWSCQPATATSTQPSCTLTGPQAAPACGTTAGTGFVINADSSITFGAVTQTQIGAASTNPTINMMSPTAALTNVTAFSGGYSAQGTTVVSLAGVATGTISVAGSSTTTATATTISVLGTMSNGSGVSAQTIPTNATGNPPDVLTLSGGAAPDVSTNHWKDVGLFTRVDIISTNNSYSRASGRTDCAASTCTYNEEIQNFANWYSFYRTRMNLMKSASTISFSPLDDKYRVGFDNICQATGTTVKRGVAQFVDSGGETANQRTNWWTQLTGSSPSCATPLRAETAKIGRYYAGKLSGATDPLQYSCQQNFMILVTDGYWNENEPAGTSITSGDVANTDNNAATAPRPYYDGQQTSTTCPATGSGRGSTASSCRTLADIAWYYYSTDLRSSANEVIVTTASAHGLSPGQSYTISGANPSGYNGTFVVFVTDSTHFGFSAPSNPGAYVSGGTVNNGTANITISAASYGSGRYSNATNASGVDVSTNNVFVSTDDPNQAQHMNFYAMGLGIDGQLEYRDDYQTAGTGDFYNISRGTANWPSVANLDPTGVDDLWHATVNGHGKYFSARNVPAVIAGLREALNKIGARVGSAAAAATSNLEPVAGDNFAYVASYATQDWVGDVQSRSIDVLTGNVSADTGSKCGQSGTGCQWSAQTKLDGMTYSTRRIYLKPDSGASGDPLRAFTWANLSGSEQLYFNPSSLSQYAALSVSNASDITAENLTKYLRGDRSLEMDGDITHAQIWRRRAHVMGDIVNTQPIFMKAPTGSYSDPGYASFKSTGTAATRRPVVFVSGQDGLLHTLNADTAAVTVNAVSVQPGEEMWSFVPTQAMSLLKNLADQNYGSTDPLNAYHHRYFVDGQITVADVNFGNNDADWHTIMIGGQGAGGSSYFALDVTDPLNPTYLWEFSDTRVGYTYANPIAAKLPNGEWAIFLSSGYNNSDGLGYLFALNPKTGAVKSGFPMSTSSGTSGAPSNLGKIAVWATDPAINNTAEYVYAGDMNGDLWRFDLEPTATGHTNTAVFKLAHLESGGVAQPITTKPEITEITSGTHIVFVGTGKYLETTDLTNTDVQGLYAIKDTLGASNLGGVGQTTWNPTTDTLPSTTNPAFIQRKLVTTKDDGSAITQTINGATRAGRMICTGASATVSATTSTCANESTPTTMDWDTYGGWFVNFPDSGERMNVDTKLVRGTLVFAGNVPAASSCTVGGVSWVTALDYASGLAVAGSNGIVSTKIADSLVVGITVVKLSSGEFKAIATKSNYQQETLSVPVAASTTTTSSSGASNFGGKRGFWREFEAY